MSGGEPSNTMTKLAVYTLRHSVWLVPRVAALPPGHPGLVVALVSLAASADDLGEIGLAQTLNSGALQAYEEMYG